MTEPHRAPHTAEGASAFASFRRSVVPTFRRILKVRHLLSSAVVLLLTATSPATGQYPDTYTIPRGALRVSFEPWYINASERFDSAGTAEPLGADLTRDSAGAGFLPSLAPAELAIQSLIGDDTYRINAGIFKTVREADVRRFPFNFQLGLSDRLTLSASLPVVTTRSQIAFSVDSTTSEMGWNPAADPDGLQDVISLMGELATSASALEAIISGGGLDCPNGPQCDAARSLVTRATSVRGNLMLMTGVLSDGSQLAALPPFSPLASSPAGSTILDNLQSISTEFRSFGVPALATALPLPADAVGRDAVQSVLAEEAFGYLADSLGFVKYKEKLGDLELGLRWGLLQGRSLRAVLSTVVRLPTGFRDSPSNFTDIGTGDKQTDIQVGLDAALEPGNLVSLALSGYYNLQMGDQLRRRITSHTRPIQLSAYELQVSRNLGDVARVAIYPAVRLAPGFTAYGSVDYYYKGPDKFSLVETSTAPPETPDVQELEIGTGVKQLNVGGGIHFRSTGRNPTSLPLEAGLLYYSSYSGSGGQAPKLRTINFYLRLFFRLFGGEGSEEPEQTPEAAPTPAQPPVP